MILENRDIKEIGGLLKKNNKLITMKQAVEKLNLYISSSFPVIPVKTGIQSFQDVAGYPPSRV